jgi:hypothetical protein
MPALAAPPARAAKHTDARHRSQDWGSSDPGFGRDASVNRQQRLVSADCAAGFEAACFFRSAWKPRVQFLPHWRPKKSAAVLGHSKLRLSPGSIAIFSRSASSRDPPASPRAAKDFVQQFLEGVHPPIRAESEPRFRFRSPGIAFWLRFANSTIKTKATCCVPSPRVKPELPTHAPPLVAR